MTKETVYFGGPLDGQIAGHFSLYRNDDGGWMSSRDGDQQFTTSCGEKLEKGYGRQTLIDNSFVYVRATAVSRWRAER